MSFLLLLVPFIFSQALSFYFNKKNFYEREGNPKVIAVLEGITGFALFAILFLLKLAPTFLIALLIVALLAPLFTKNKIVDSTIQLDTQMEHVKNILLLNILVFLPFYIGLTIFRFKGLFIQVSASFGVLLVVLLLAYILQKLIAPLYEKVIYQNTSFLYQKLIYFFTFTFLCVGLILIFNFPSVQINRFTNLENSKPLISNLDNHASNRFKEEVIGVYPIDEGFESAYLSSNQDAYYIVYDVLVIIIDRTTNDIVYNGHKSNTTDPFVDGITNTEYAEVVVKEDCDDQENCLVVSEGTYQYGYTKIPYYRQLKRYNDLTYESANVAILNTDYMLLFNEQFDVNLVNMHLAEPFIEFNTLKERILDVDQIDGSIVFLRYISKDDSTKVEIVQLVEKEVAITLPIYTHFNVLYMVPIIIALFIPITNWDKFITESSFEKNVISKENTTS